MNILEKIENGFEEMVKSGKVDFSIIEDLKKFRDELLISKMDFKRKTGILKDFPIFYALETQIRIIDQMICRVNLAPQVHDNPIVADDSLLVMPHLKLVSNNLANKLESDPYYLLELSSKLQRIAMKSNLYPPPKQISKSISKIDLENNFNKFAESVGEEIERV